MKGPAKETDEQLVKQEEDQECDGWKQVEKVYQGAENDLNAADRWSKMRTGYILNEKYKGHLEKSSSCEMSGTKV